MESHQILVKVYGNYQNKFLHSYLLVNTTQQSLIHKICYISRKPVQFVDIKQQKFGKQIRTAILQL